MDTRLVAAVAVLWVVLPLALWALGVPRRIVLLAALACPTAFIVVWLVQDGHTSEALIAAVAALLLVGLVVREILRRDTSRKRRGLALDSALPTVGALNDWERLVPVVLVLLAGPVGFLAHAAGEFGPMVVFGHADANRDIPLAWVQIPFHVVLAITLAVGGPTGLRALIRLAGLVVVLLHFMWMTLLTVRSSLRWVTTRIFPTYWPP